MPETDAITARPVAAATTDMMHRRVPLPHRFHVRRGRTYVCIRTDFAKIGEALRSIEDTFGLGGEIVHGEWEIAVEAQIADAAALKEETGAEEFEVFRFGLSRAVRMANGSWFAHTPPAMNGVGFAMVMGDERKQIRQLAAFLTTILRVLAESGDRDRLCAKCEVVE